jgi:hypothetical protein
LIENGNIEIDVEQYCHPMRRKLSIFSGKVRKLSQDSIHYPDGEGGPPTDKAALTTK